MHLSLKRIVAANFKVVRKSLGNREEFRVDPTTENANGSKIQDRRKQRYCAEHQGAVAHRQAKSDGVQQSMHWRTSCSRRRAPYGAAAEKSPCRSFAVAG